MRLKLQDKSKRFQRRMTYESDSNCFTGFGSACSKRHRRQKTEYQIAKKIAVTGFGDPYEKWRDALVSLKQEMELSKVRIVLPASLCSTKIIRVPYAKGKKLDEIVKHETADSFKDGVYDYIILQSDKKDGLTVCCGNIEKTVSDRGRSVICTPWYYRYRYDNTA